MNINIELFIAICAVLFAFYQAWLSRHHNRLSVAPHLQWSHSRNWTDQGLEYRLIVENFGLGPARIKCVELFSNGTAFAGETDDPIRELIEKSFAGIAAVKVNSSGYPRKGYIIKAQGDFGLVVAAFPGLKKEDVPKLETIRANIDLRIVYESFYGKQYELDTRK